jgi:DTW domain-containing protein
LQHPLEVNETKGTARLLHLSLPNSQLLIGEVFDEADLFSINKSSNNSNAKYSILLYPTTPEDHSLGIAAPPELESALLINPKNIRLIIIDGTWRKSRKILCKNPYLQQLPRLVLQDLPVSGYSIRKARKSHQLSTLEATCAALAQLEDQINGYKAKFEPITQSFLAFNAFIALQMQFSTK